MSTIKTWAERAESLSDDTVVTSLHLAQFKQDEIDELRAENARLRDALGMMVHAQSSTLGLGDSPVVKFARAIEKKVRGEA